MYGDRLDYSFHLETLKELLRVIRDEVRILPLVYLNGKRYQHLEELLGEFKSEISYEEEKVEYEFQKKCSYNVKGI